MNSEKAIIKFSEIYYNENVGKNSKEARRIIMDLKYQKNHKFLQMIAQTYLDEATFENGDIMREKVNFHKLYYAKLYIMKSLSLSNKCIRALWVLAKINEKYKLYKNAINIFKRIIRTDPKFLIHNTCITNLETAKMIINDSKFELYRNYYYLDIDKSKRYFEEYELGIKEGIKTIYKPFSKFKAKTF